MNADPPAFQPANQQASLQVTAAMAFSALVACMLFLYHETTLSLVRLWIVDVTYQHGLFLAGLCAFLFYRRWIEVRDFMQVRPALSAAVLIALVSCSWGLASLVCVLKVQQLSLLVLLALLVASIMGYRTAWLFAVPIGLLSFAVPVWDALAPHLQWLTAHMVTSALNLTGFPATLEGTEISVAAGIFEVKPACAGLGQLVVGVLGGVLFVHVNRLRRQTAFWVLGAAACVPLLTNWLRVYSTVVIGQLNGMQTYFVTQHWAPGWILFGVGMFLLFWFVTRCVRADDQTSARANVRPIAPKVGETSVVGSALLSVTALMLGPALLYVHHSERPDSDLVQMRLDLPAEIAAWRTTRGLSDGYRPVFQYPDAEHEAIYQDVEAKQVYLYAAEYLSQEPGKEAVYVGNGVYDGEIWKPMSARALRSGAINVRETRIRSKSDAEKLVWQWYYVHGFTVGNDYMAKLLNAWGVLNGDPGIAVVVVATDLTARYDDAAGLLERFVMDSWQTLRIELGPVEQRQAVRATRVPLSQPKTSLDLVAMKESSQKI